MNGLSDVVASVTDGKITCSFVRAAVTNLVLPNDLGEATIDLGKFSNRQHTTLKTEEKMASTAGVYFSCSAL